MPLTGPETVSLCLLKSQCFAKVQDLRQLSQSIRSWLVYFFDVHGDNVLVTVMDLLCSNIDMNVTFSSCNMLTRHACTFITAWPPNHAQNSYFEPIAKFCHNLVVIATPGHGFCTGAAPCSHQVARNNENPKPFKKTLLYGAGYHSLGGVLLIMS
jgi:hypothetical protein